MARSDDFQIAIEAMAEGLDALVSVLEPFVPPAGDWSLPTARASWIGPHTLTNALHAVFDDIPAVPGDGVLRSARCRIVLGGSETFEPVVNEGETGPFFELFFTDGSSHYTTPVHRASMSGELKPEGRASVAHRNIAQDFEATRQSRSAQDRQSVQVTTPTDGSPAFDWDANDPRTLASILTDVRINHSLPDPPATFGVRIVFDGATDYSVTAIPGQDGLNWTLVFADESTWSSKFPGAAARNLAPPATVQPETISTTIDLPTPAATSDVDTNDLVLASEAEIRNVESIIQELWRVVSEEVLEPEHETQLRAILALLTEARDEAKDGAESREGLRARVKGALALLFGSEPLALPNLWAYYEVFQRIGIHQLLDRIGFLDEVMRRWPW